MATTMNPKEFDTIEGVRGFLATAVKTFERNGVFLQGVRIVRDENTNEVLHVNLSYEVRDGQECGTVNEEEDK